MTDLVNDKKCKDCSHYDGDVCGQSNSDHYGDMLALWHQACGQYDGLQEPSLCRKCKLKHVEQNGDVCFNCVHEEYEEFHRNIH